MNKLQLGVKAHQTGQLLEARRHYQEHLNHHPNDFNAWQLIGLVHSSLGEIDKAIEYLKRSLNINPEQPQVTNSLGVCQKQKQSFDEAKASFLKAIDLKNDYLDSHKNLIRLLLDISDHEAAKSAVEKSKRYFPDHPEVKKLEADYYRHIENYASAIPLLESLLQVNPKDILTKHSLALSLRMDGQSARALEFYNQLEQGGLDKFQLFHNKANAMADLGQLENAVKYYRKALQKNPAYVESHQNLNELLWELGEQEKFLRSYTDAFELLPFDLELRFSYASTLLRLGEYDVAFAFLKQLPKTAEQEYQYFNLLGLAYKGLGDNNKALKIQRRACQFDNAPASASINLAGTLLQTASYSEAQDILNEALKNEPENKHVWALLGIAWKMLDDPRSTLLNDYDNLVREYLIDIPDGFDSIEEFCRQLNTYLKSLHTAKIHPLEQTLAGGTQTKGNLFDDSNPLVQTLVKSIEKCIRVYIEETKEFSGALPIIESAENFQFSGSWSVLLKQNGFHNQHVHPMGWISSAFYVQLPSSVENDHSKEGWLKIGASSVEVANEPVTEKHVKPVVGKLVLFQSYMWHGTIPFESDEERMTIAFDVIKEQKKP